jgi:hypothetical protein
MMGVEIEGAEMVFGLINSGLLVGIFYRLGGLTKANADFERRLGKIEGLSNA